MPVLLSTAVTLSLSSGDRLSKEYFSRWERLAEKIFAFAEVDICAFKLPNRKWNRGGVFENCDSMCISRVSSPSDRSAV
jgi:hypothetical protein